MGGAAGFDGASGQQQENNETEHDLFLFGEKTHGGNIQALGGFQRKYCH
jgi:hypothetical protein